MHCGFLCKYCGKYNDATLLIVLKEFCTGSSCTLYQYHLISENKTWTEAQSYCRVNYTDLATINNMQEMGRLLDTVYGIYSGSVWIGLYDDLDSWKWSLDDDLFYKEGERSFRNWWISQPTYWLGYISCVYISGYDMVWQGIPCYYTLPFICFDGEHSSYTYAT